jgi:hypothetical protein
MMPAKLSKFALIASLICLLHLHVYASIYEQRHISAVYTDTPPIIDCNLNDTCWKTAPIARDFVDSYTGQTVIDQTEARICYDSKAIYVSFLCHDSHPEDIIAQEIRYGANLGNEDTVSFYIDPFYSRSWNSLSSFTVNAIGTQSDSFAGGRAAKREWRGVWTAAAKKTPDGWQAEMRIPWKILSFIPTGASQPMGIDFVRHHQRLQISTMWSDVTSAQRADFIGVWDSVHPPHTMQKPVLQMLQSTTAQYSQEGGTPLRAGMDIRYSPTPVMTGLITIAPDFKSIEQAIEGINFTRSERYQGESRPFFQDGSSYYPGLFYSRRIEAFDAGIKIFGNVNDRFSLGLLTTQKGLYENASIVNLKYSFQQYGKCNFYGMMRRHPDSSHDATGFGFQMQNGLWNSNFGWARAREGDNNGDKGDLSFGYSLPHWYANTGWGCVSPGFSPSLGYVPFTDRRIYYAGVGSHWEYRSGTIRSFRMNMNADSSYHYSGALYDQGISGGINLSTKLDYAFGIYRDVSRFENKHDHVWGLSINGNINDPYKSWGSSLEFGTRDDTLTRYFNFWINRRIYKKLDIGLSGSTLMHEQHQEQFILTTGWEFDDRRSVSARTVYHDGKTNIYFAFRNSGGVGADLYITVGDPNADSFSRIISVKWIYAL